MNPNTIVRVGKISNDEPTVSKLDGDRSFGLLRHDRELRPMPQTRGISSALTRVSLFSL